MHELPEEKQLWKEKVETEKTEDQSEDPFVPARELTEEEKKMPVLIRIEL